MSRAKGVSLHEADEEKVGAPALGFSVQVDLGDGQNAVLQTHVPNDCGDDELYAMLDKMSRAGRRLRAKHKLDEIERELEKHEKALRQFLEDKDRIDGEFAQAQEKRRATLEIMQKEIGGKLDAARQEHEGSGRRGPFIPSGSLKSVEKASSAAIAKLQAEILTAKAENGQAQDNLQVSVKRYSDEITALKRERSKNRALCGEPDTE